MPSVPSNTMGSTVAVTDSHGGRDVDSSGSATRAPGRRSFGGIPDHAPPPSDKMMGRNGLHRLMEQSSYPERKMLSIIREKLLAGLDIECMDVFGKTPLHRAAELGKAAALRALIANGASVSSRTRDGLTAMHLAAGNGHADVVKQLLLQGCSPNTPDGTGELPLHSAARWGRLQVIIQLHTAGCSLEAMDNDGRTAMHVAAEYGRIDVLRELLRRGGRPSPSDRCGRMPVSLAERCGNQEAAQLFSKVQGSNCSDAMTRIMEDASAASGVSVTAQRRPVNGLRFFGIGLFG